MNNIIEIKMYNIGKAANVLVNAFKDDPFTNYIFQNEELYYLAAPKMFQSWLKWCVLYGKAWATDDFESVAIRKTSKKIDFSWWSMFRAGFFRQRKYFGEEVFKRYMKYIYTLIESSKTAYPVKFKSWYAWAIGTKPEEQRKGYGKMLIEHTFSFVDKEKVPITLETNSEKNVEMHKKFGYKLVYSTKVPDSELDIFFMIRHPNE